MLQCIGPFYKRKPSFLRNPYLFSKVCRGLGSVWECCRRTWNMKLNQGKGAFEVIAFTSRGVTSCTAYAKVNTHTEKLIA